LTQFRKITLAFQTLSHLEAIRGPTTEIGQMAEGEELGSNLLRVAQSSLWGPDGSPGVSAPTHPVRPADETVQNQQ